MEESLANKGISVEGSAKAKAALEAAGIEVVKENEILVQRLKQDQPGQLGKISRLMAQEGVNIEIIYSDHSNQLILVVDDFEKGRVISDNWEKVIYDI